MASTASAAGAFTVTARAAKHRAHQGRLASRDGHARHNQADHQRVVVDPGHEDEEHGGVGHTGDHRLGGVDATRSCGPGDTPCAQHQGSDDGQAPCLDGNPRMSARYLREQT